MVESLYLQSNIPPFPDISTLLWQVNILRAAPSGYLLARAKCKYPEMGGYLLCILRPVEKSFTLSKNVVAFLGRHLKLLFGLDDT